MSSLWSVSHGSLARGWVLNPEGEGSVLGNILSNDLVKRVMWMTCAWMCWEIRVRTPIVLTENNRGGISGLSHGKHGVGVKNVIGWVDACARSNWWGWVWLGWFSWRSVMWCDQNRGRGWNKGCGQGESDDGSQKVGEAVMWPKKFLPVLQEAVQWCKCHVSSMWSSKRV